MVETIFTSPLFVETILPFLLIFTLMFAILEKTKILGDGKRQIDAIVALVIGLMFVAFGNATRIITQIIPILGVALVVILIFMILLGSMWQKDFEMPKFLKIVVGILAGLVVVVSVLILTGGLDYVVSFIYNDKSGIFVNGLLFLIIIGAIAAVVWGSGKGDSKSGEKK